MTELKFERKETLSRDDAVSRLRAIADALDGNDRQAELELEIELKWATRERARHTGAEKSDTH
jgi:hypothetical protein